MGRPYDKAGSEANIHKVAATAKVSIATVSRVFNRVASVHPILAARVWKAIEELGYVPNSQARALGSGRSRLLGLIVSDMTNPFFPELIQSFEQSAVTNGYEVLISSTSCEMKCIQLCIRRMMEREVDGIAIMTFGMKNPLPEQMVSRDIPIVFVDDGFPHSRSTVLSIDYSRGIQQGVQHLAALGHRKIGFISGPLHLNSALTRKESFLESLKKVDLKPSKEWMLESDHTLKGGHETMLNLLKFGKMPTALMCSNDMTAIGILRASRDQGFHVPGDLSVIGFDDIQLAEYIFPSLTSIEMPCRNLARSAVNALIAHLSPNRRSNSQQSIKITTRLVVRETTGSPARDFVRAKERAVD